MHLKLNYCTCYNVWKKIEASSVHEMATQRKTDFMAFEIVIIQQSGLLENEKGKRKASWIVPGQFYLPVRYSIFI